MTPARDVRSPLALSVGVRLRELREWRGLTLGETARRSALGKGTLSELETGRRNPTLDTLYAVTTALGVPLSAVLPDDLDHEARGAQITGDAMTATLVAQFDDVSASTEVYRVDMPAAGFQRSAAHAPGVSEHWLIFVGTLAAGPEGSEISGAAGDSITFRADTPHAYRVGPGEDVAATLIVRYPQPSPATKNEDAART